MTMILTSNESRAPLYDDYGVKENFRGGIRTKREYDNESTTRLVKMKAINEFYSTEYETGKQLNQNIWIEKW